MRVRPCSVLGRMLFCTVHQEVAASNVVAATRNRCQVGP